MTLKESVSKQLTKKADFKEIETLASALSIKADSDALTNQIGELKSFLLTKLSKSKKDSATVSLISDL